MSFDYTMEGLTYPDFNHTFKLTDSVTDMDSLEGLAVEQDTTAANAVKLATDGGKVIGFILVAENGVSQGEGITVTVATKGGRRVTTAAQLSVGDFVCGGGNGTVKASVTVGDNPTAVETDIRVWEVINATTAVVFQK